MRVLGDTSPAPRKKTLRASIAIRGKKGPKKEGHKILLPSWGRRQEKNGRGRKGGIRKKFEAKDCLPRKPKLLKTPFVRPPVCS